MLDKGLICLQNLGCFEVSNAENKLRKLERKKIKGKYLQHAGGLRESVNASYSLTGSGW